MKKARFFLCFLLPVLLFFLLPLPLSLFFSPVEKKVNDLDFPSQKALLEEALREAELEYENLGVEDDLSQPRQKILFYRAALDYEMPVWNGDFYFESTSVYAAIIREWEILNAYPSPETEERKRYLEEKATVLEDILARKSIPDYLSFYSSFLEGEGQMEKDEIESEISSLSLKFYASLDGVMSSGESSVISHIRAIEESLKTDTQRYHPAYLGTPLSQKERDKLSEMRTFLLESLEEGRLDPLPANSETLRFCEDIGSFLLFLGFTLLSVQRKAPYSKKSLFLLFLFSTIAFWGGLIASTAVFAPRSLVHTPLFAFGRFIRFPALLATLLRIVLGTLSYLPFFLLAHILRSRTERSAFYTLIPPLSALLYDMISLFLRLTLGKSPALYFLPFFYTDLKSALLPDYPFYLPQTPSPILTLSIFSLLCTLLFLLWKKTNLLSFLKKRK